MIGEFVTGDILEVQPLIPVLMLFKTSSDKGDSKFALAEPTLFDVIGLSETVLTFGERFPFPFPAEMIGCNC